MLYLLSEIEKKYNFKRQLVEAVDKIVKIQDKFMAGVNPPFLTLATALLIIVLYWKKMTF